MSLGFQPDARGNIAVRGVVADVVHIALDLLGRGIEVVVEHRDDRAAFVAHDEGRGVVELRALGLVGFGARLLDQLVEVRPLEVGLVRG